ncbi:MAG: hypothetical protein HY298_15575 [Verrucomicrobia bacterium]|nr:hypothetical protein [Verrucomicrobiota bacterium]
MMIPFQFCSVRGSEAAVCFHGKRGGFGPLHRFQSVLIEHVLSFGSVGVCVHKVPSLIQSAITDEAGMVEAAIPVVLAALAEYDSRRAPPKPTPENI